MSPKREVLRLLETLDDSASFGRIHELIHARELELTPAQVLEQQNLAEAGRKLAAKTWPAEDFSDWEPDHGQAKAG